MRDYMPRNGIQPEHQNAALRGCLTQSKSLQSSLMKLRTLFLASAIVLLSIGVSRAYTGPTSILYLMNYGEYSGGTVVGLDMLQGNTFNSVPTGNPVDICIAASGDIRTYGYVPSTSGSRFDLLGNPLSGGPYVNTYGNQMHDGTSDGIYNYSVDYTTGDVIRFDRNWASPVVLFNVPNGTVGWITMNATDGSFWLSQYGGPDLVEHRNHFGALLGSFNSGVVGSQGLALDPVDGTLWMSQGYNLYQFSQAGAPLQSFAVGAASGGGWYGMEFDILPAPEPSSIALGIAGITCAGLRAHRRRRP
jgi:hypothetical protein